MANKSRLEVVGTIIASVALIGPSAYLCLALFEYGRLQYFEAPNEFINFGSFGIYPVLSKVIPVAIMMLFTGGVFGSAFSVKGKIRFIRISAGMGMTFCMLSIYSATPYWKWSFGGAMFLCALPGLVFNQSVPQPGNANEIDASRPDHPSIASAKRLHHMVFSLIPLGVFAWIFIAAGNRDGESQKEFWESNQGVIIGFYGENVLLMPKQGDTVGNVFKVIKLEDAGELVLKPLGPDLKKKLIED